ncbi:MAG: hypothetical protein VCD34_11600, partial [Planctomycetota bacterium]
MLSLRLLRYVFYTLTILPLLCPAYGDEDVHPEEHAHHAHGSTGHEDYSPLGVMGNHVHQAGEAMFSYRYGIMEMNGNLDGSTSVSTEDILDADFMMAPTSMRMEMHMLGAMYAASDSITLMAMLPLKRIEMSSRNSVMTRKAKTSGAGDLKLAGILPLWAATDQSRTLKLNAGLSIPTGSIKEGGTMRYAYPMQLGSGTFDLLPGLTYLEEKDSWSWGAQATSVIRLGENGEGYSLGNRFRATTWYSSKLSDTLSASARIEGTTWGNIDGQDDELTPEPGENWMSPNARADLRGGERVDILFGLNIFLDTDRWNEWDRLFIDKDSGKLYQAKPKENSMDKETRLAIE